MRGSAQAWVQWRKQTGTISAQTAKDQRYVIGYFVDFMGDRQLRQVGERDMERWRESMTGTLAPRTIRQRWRTAYAFLEWAVDEGKIRRNPARRIPSPKVPRSVHRNLRPDQSAALHNACVDSRERLIVALGFQLAMRRGEIARAQIGDLDLTAHTLFITGKGGHERTISLTVEAERAIANYLVDLRSNAGPLVRDAKGVRAITPGRIGDIFRAVAYRSGVKVRSWDGVATHSARHTAGTDIAHNSHDPTIVRDFLGHASLTSTDIYIGAVDLVAQRLAVEGRRYAS